jgi:hypothetical protein
VIEGDTRVIVASRDKILLRFVASVTLSAVGGFLVSSHLGLTGLKGLLASWGALVFFGLMAVLWGLQLFWPARLVLDRGGVTFHNLIRTSHRRWVDIGRIEVRQIRSARIVKLKARPGYGSDLALGGAWPLSADELVSLLGGYVVRYGRAVAA